jgi:hypothetical protein
MPEDYQCQHSANNASMAFFDSFGAAFRVPECDRESGAKKVTFFDLRASTRLIERG